MNSNYKIKKSIEALKEAGEWTECHEKGHDLISPENIICLRCGKDFNDLASTANLR